MRVTKRGMFQTFFSLGFVGLMLMFSPGQTVNAQYLVSTKAGFLNRAEGKVFIQRQENENGDRGRATLGTQMKDGDLLSTGSGSRAEILLNPGSYLRLNEKTEVRAIRTSLTEPTFAVLQGSVIIEISQPPKETAVQIVTPQGPVSMSKEGIQRIDVTPEGTTVAVRQGEVVLGTIEQLFAKGGFKVGKGKVVRLSGTNGQSGQSGLMPGEGPLLAKVDKDAVDQFDLWSFSRAQTLMAANAGALRRSSLSGSMAYGWYYDSFYNCYTFIPGRGLVFSPYGFPFFRRYSDCYYYFPYGYNYYPSYDWGGGGGGGVGSARVIAGHDRAPIRREMEGRAVREVGDSSFGSASGGSRGVSTGGGSTGSVSMPSAPVSASGGASRGGDSGGGQAGRPSRP